MRTRAMLLVSVRVWIRIMHVMCCAVAVLVVLGCAM